MCLWCVCLSDVCVCVCVSGVCVCVCVGVGGLSTMRYLSC